jgi:hypothetical protein
VAAGQEKSMDRLGMAEVVKHGDGGAANLGLQQYSRPAAFFLFFFHFSLHLIFFLLCWPCGHEESSAV